MVVPVLPAAGLLPQAGPPALEQGQDLLQGLHPDYVPLPNLLDPPHLDLDLPFGMESNQEGQDAAGNPSLDFEDCSLSEFLQM